MTLMFIMKDMIIMAFYDFCIIEWNLTCDTSNFYDLFF